jgi:phosphonate transport system substrate-binding protein
MSANPSMAAPNRRPARSRLGQTIAILAFIVLVLGAGVAWVYHSEWKDVQELDALRKIGIAMRHVNADALALDADLKDADGDMVADVSADPAKEIDPSTLIFVPLPGPRGEVAGVWDDFKAHLSKITGKPVEYRDQPDPIELRRLLREGKIHVCGVNTGGVPAAVNAGFVPVCVPASADGTFGYEMEFLVPADSPVKMPLDLKGKTLMLTDPGSLSGYRAALVALKKDNRLTPGRDVNMTVSGSHDASIRALAAKRCDAISVASDMLHRAEANGVIKPAQYRSIYKSAKFPPAAYGHPYNLKPGTAAKVREAFLGFDWKGTGLEKSLGAAGQAKFVPISYKTDWVYVREIDREIMSWGQ